MKSFLHLHDLKGGLVFLDVDSIKIIERPTDQPGGSEIDGRRFRETVEEVMTVLNPRVKTIKVS